MLKKFLITGVALAFATTAFAGAYISGPLDIPTFGGGTVPSDPALFKNELKAAKEASKLTGKLAKCYQKGAQNVSKGKPDKVASCIGTGDPAGKGALDKYAKGITKIMSKAPGLPGCTNYLAQGGIIDTLVKSFNPIILCSSPSGAFVDGAAGL